MRITGMRMKRMRRYEVMLLLLVDGGEEVGAPWW